MDTSWQFRGGPLAYRMAGTGDPLVLITGLGGGANFWDAQWSWLAERFQVVTFDHPGSGASAPPERPLSVGDLAELVVGLLDHLGWRQATMLGHSMGGTVAQTLGLDYPDRVERLVLSATWAAPDAYFRKAFAWRAQLLRNGDLATYGAVQSLLAYPPSLIAERREWVEDQEATLVQGLKDPEIMAGRIDALLAFDRSDEIARLAQACLVLGVADDQIVPIHMVRRLAGLIPGAQVEALSFGGHFAPLVAPEAYRTAIEPWLCG